tara:strand:- start:787 stop:1194 length:408 start_codon:yes stop_codon:yes gene_type:complete
MKLTNEKLTKIIREELKEGLFDFLRKDEPEDFRSHDYWTREKRQKQLSPEEKERLEAAVRTTESFLTQDLSAAERLEGFHTLRRNLRRILDPSMPLKEEDKPNPWAICTASVGREDKKKYEDCVMSVKEKHGIKK